MLLTLVLICGDCTSTPCPHKMPFTLHSHSPVQPFWIAINRLSPQSAQGDTTIFFGQALLDSTPELIDTGTMPYLKLEAQRIYYTRPTHNPGRPALVLIHGAGGSRLDWPKAVQRLPGVSVYNFDLPGHGRSDLPGREHITAYGQTVLALLKALDLTQVVLVGHSMGGAIAQQVALQQPPGLSGLVLIGTAARLRVAPQLLQTTDSDLETAVAFILEHAAGPMLPPELRAQGRERLLENDADVLRGDFLACNNFDLRNQVANIKLPALVISSTNDRMVPLQFARQLSDALPQSELIVLPKAGHFQQLEQPQAVAQAMRAFITRLSPSA